MQLYLSTYIQVDTASSMFFFSTFTLISFNVHQMCEMEFLQSLFSFPYGINAARRQCTLASHVFPRKKHGMICSFSIN